jgi:hypothetical protein
MKFPNLLLTFSILFAFTAQGQTAEEIVANHIKAIGGMDAWKSITSIKIELVNDDNGTETQVERYVVQGKGFKRVASLGGMSGYTIYTPTEGYSFYPWGRQQKPEAITPEDLKENEDVMDIPGPLIDYKAKGHSIAYVGMDEYEGTDCYKIVLTEKSGKIITYYIDPSNYFIIHRVELYHANGQESEDETDFSNYRKLPEGIWMAMNIGNDLKIKKVYINVPIDDAMFKIADN